MVLGYGTIAFSIDTWAPVERMMFFCVGRREMGRMEGWATSCILDLIVVFVNSITRGMLTHPKPHISLKSSHPDLTNRIGATPAVIDRHAETSVQCSQVQEKL